MDIVILCFEFFKTGLFSIGGGLATLPFLYEMANNYDWFTHSDLADMIAIAESTPGPLGINISTYAGFNALASKMGLPFGILGGVSSTLSLVAPSYVVIVIIANMLAKFRTNKYVNKCFEVLRPVVNALILSASLEIFKLSLLKIDDNFHFEGISSIISVLSIPNIILFAVMLFAVAKYKLHPIVYIAAGAVCGIIFKGFI